MDNLRRKIILSVPLFSMGGALVGCGEDSTGLADQPLNERASAQALAGVSGQSLRLTAISVLSTLDPIWTKSTYLVPNTTHLVSNVAVPIITGCVNDNGLHLSMTETIPATLTNDVTIIRSLILSLSNGLPIKAGSRFTFDGKKRCSGVLTVLKRTSPGSANSVEQVYVYEVVESTVSPGIVQLSKTVGEDYTLQLSNLKLAAKKVPADQVSTYPAVKGMKLAGSTTFKARIANANWM